MRKCTKWPSLGWATGAMLLALPFTMLAQKSEPADFYPAISLGLSTGAPAYLGADATLSFFRPVAFRIGYYRAKFNSRQFSQDLSDYQDGQELDLDAGADLSTFGLLADLPIVRGRWLRIVGGAMINLDNHVTVSGRFAEGIPYNDYTISPEQAGSLTTTYTTSRVFPYLAIGLGRAVPQKRFGLSLEAGGMLRGKPEIAVASTGLLEGNEANGPVLSENFSNVRFQPSVNLRLAVRLDLPAPDPAAARQQEEDAQELAEEQESVQPSQQETTPNAAVDSSPEQAPEAAEEAPPEPESQEAEAQEPPKRRKTPKRNKPAAEPETEAEETKIAQPASPVNMVRLQGTAVDAQSGNTLQAVYLDLYLVAADGSKRLERTGRYPGGTFTLGLLPGKTYELTLIEGGYQPLTKTILVEAAPEAALIEQTFSLQQNP